ncbi:MAG: anaerobic ribonucleoside-triphosphate reductase activating protein [Lachnospiraceae bacterium]|nr:anaerobic ribonucleoside-triphosphate reductase activating protein [Lachnospiraceae bacterium]
MQIHGLSKLTLLDYPGHIAATIFTGGCNFRCPYCHNKELVIHPEQYPTIPEEEVLSFLKSRVGKLQGVCVTGGEATLQPDLEDFIKQIKDMGLLVKLDTNGYRPEIVRKLMDEKCIDYVAMDIKNSKEKYALTCGLSTMDIARLEETAQLLMESDLQYEFRTTVVQELHDKDDMEKIGQWIRGAKAYFLQSYEESEGVIRPGFSAKSKEELEEMLKIARVYVPQAALRGVEG